MRSQLVPGQPTNTTMSPLATPRWPTSRSDHPRDGSPHLYPQPGTSTAISPPSQAFGVSTLSAVICICITPSGPSTPFVDSFGRLVFIRWDHLVQDRNATR